jgi:hypothetical protein
MRINQGGDSLVADPRDLGSQVGIRPVVILRRGNSDCLHLHPLAVHVGQPTGRLGQHRQQIGEDLLVVIGADPPVAKKGILGRVELVRHQAPDLGNQNVGVDVNS